MTEFPVADRIIFLSFIFLPLFHIAGAQDTIPLIRSGEVIREASTLNEDGKYDEAVSAYLTIPESDTNYVYMLSELTHTYLLSGENEKALKTGKAAAQNRSEHGARILLGIGRALNNLGEYEKATSVYREAIEKFPYNHLLHFNLGVTLFILKDYNAAVKRFQQALMLRPLHAASHLYLGKCMILMGMRTKAIFSLETYLAIHPSDNKTLVLLENLVTDAVQEEGSAGSFDGEKPFHEADLILKSKAALDDRFVSDILLDASIIRQTELLFEILPYQSQADDFWVKYYIPFYKAIYDKNLIKPFIYTWLGSVKNDKISEWKESNKPLLREFYTTANDQLSTWSTQGPATMPDETRTTKPYWYYDSKELHYIGDLNEGGDPAGYWQVFYRNGHKQAEGFFNDTGEKDGVWKYYYKNGMIKSVEVESEGVLTDTLKVYHDNGIIQSLLPYNRGKLHGTARYYFNCGDIREVTDFTNGLRNGAHRTYFISQKPAAVMHYINDTLQGPYTSYYSSGGRHERYRHLNGQIDGAYSEYYRNGALKETGMFQDGMKNGTWRGYYQNTRIKFEGEIKDDLRSGKWIDYYSNGNVKETKNYRNGLLEGDYKIYDRDGILHHIDIYEEDTLKGQKFFDKSGIVLSDEYNAQGNFTITACYPDGKPEFTGTYKNGLLEGEVVTRYPSGGKQVVQYFKKGIKDGPLRKYFETGEPEYGVDFSDGVENGYYRSFYQNGVIQAEGWFVAGTKQQQWIIYDKKGNLEEVSYYINDQLHGVNMQYAPGNKPYLMNRYQYGDLAETLQYDSSGAVVNKENYESGYGTMVTYYQNKKIRSTIDVRCGLPDESTFAFFPDGKSKLTSSNPDSAGIISITAYYPSGGILATGASTDGERTGEWKWYFESGKPETEGRYESGLKTGMWTDYYENGKVRTKRHFTEDELSGTTSYFDSFGALIYEKTYIDGNPVYYRYREKDGSWSEKTEITNGVLKSYFPNGKLSAIEHYLNGYYDGVRKIYFSNGKLFRILHYSKGLLQGEVITYFASGRIKTKGIYLDNERHGLWTSYYKNGKIHEQKTYYLGKLHGRLKKYDKNGQPVSEIYYWNDELY